jgi:hypothetical protein
VQRPETPTLAVHHMQGVDEPDAVAGRLCDDGPMARARAVQRMRRGVTIES